MAENDITKYTGKDWDAEHIAITVDGIAPNIYASSGDLFTAAWDNNNITIAVDAKGNGMRAINHNGSANLTLNLSRMSNIWGSILEDQDNYRTKMHKITISTDAERITTDTANLQKIPDISGNGNVPDAAVVFECINLTAHSVD